MHRICKRKKKYYCPLYRHCCGSWEKKYSFSGTNKETKREDGNFDFFINWKAKFDPVLKSHLSHCSKNATYTSSVIQNEPVKLAGDEVKSSI